MGRAKDPLGTRSLLVKLTLELIEERGCEKFTFNELLERSGLSKGAIFHHVAGKNELFMLALEELLSNVDSLFKIDNLSPDLSHGEIFDRLWPSVEGVANPASAANRILAYLLSRNDEPGVAEALERVYRLSLEHSVSWLEAGQKSGLFRQGLDVQAVAERLVLFNLGLRIRAKMSKTQHSFNAKEFLEMMLLQVSKNT